MARLEIVMVEKGLSTKQMTEAYKIDESQEIWRDAKIRAKTD